MKKFTLLIALCALFSMASFAQKGLRMQPLAKVAQQSLSVKGVNRQAQTAVKNSRRAGEELVTVPEGVSSVPFIMYYSDKQGLEHSKPVNTAIDGNDVYIRGFSEYLPEAWVKGTKDGNSVTFAGNQYMGKLDTEESYFFYGEESVVFTYDAEEDSYSFAGEIFGIIADKYDDGHYYYPVLEKIVEKAGTPATPSITGIKQTNFGDVLVFDVPLVDDNGNTMVASKLSYQFFVEEDGETNPLTFTTTDYTKLTENLTVIPYGFTDNFDIYATYVYLNMPHNTWSKIGIQSIYTGGGEEHKSEISWFNLANALPVVAPEGLETEVYNFTASALEGNKTEAEDYTYQTAIGFDGNDVYIKGLSENTEEMWIKGTKNEAGKYVIPANQYIGQLGIWGYTFDYFLAAKDAEGNAVDIVLNYDTDKKQFTTDQTVVLNGAVGEWDPYQTFTEVKFTKFVEIATTPVASSIESVDFAGTYPKIYCSIPVVGTNGDALNLKKLFYTIWIEKEGTQAPYTFTTALYSQDFTEDVKEVPYKHDGYDIYTGGSIVYFEESAEELASWTNIGIQSIYYGGGECNKSAVAWYNNGATGISNVKADNQKAVIYNMAGQRVDSARKGIYIVNGRKVVVK